jgi:hypothetical protein
MKYKIYSTLEEAQKISRNKACYMGCHNFGQCNTCHYYNDCDVSPQKSLNDAKITEFWWVIIAHPNTQKVAIAVPEEDEQEFTNLKEYTELEIDGWFPELINI